MPTCAKQPSTAALLAEPQALITTRDALLRLSREVAQRQSKRVTLPALPSAIERWQLAQATEGR